ncbi:hypothetical protein ACP70R_014522 [Stipagrostis hirtigluma subsp. patula]
MKRLNGKTNRPRLPYVHRKGTKSFVALQHELEQMVEMQQETAQEGASPLIEPQICELSMGLTGWQALCVKWLGFRPLRMNFFSRARLQ